MRESNLCQYKYRDNMYKWGQIAYHNFTTLDKNFNDPIKLSIYTKCTWVCFYCRKYL